MPDWKHGSDPLTRAARSRAEFTNFSKTASPFHAFAGFRYEDSPKGTGSEEQVPRQYGDDAFRYALYRKKKKIESQPERPRGGNPMKTHGQPYDFGELEVYMHPDNRGVYSPHFLVPRGVEVLTGDKGEPIGLYNIKTGRSWGLPQKGAKYPFIKVQK